jgi:RNA polymerase sigma factor (sigma-70 family)
MAASAMNRVIGHLRSAVDLRTGAEVTDGQLLAGFLAKHNEAAFAALVCRHGPMVWGVCRRVLGNSHDAEDAFQATFLILVRKAASIASRELLANWLYGVAHRTALNAKTTNAKRRAKERQVPVMPELEAGRRDSGPELQAFLDQELSHLPDKYRVVIILCDLEGKTRRETARELDLPEGTVAGRLARARAMLAKRLARHRVIVSGGALAALLAQDATARVPASLALATIRALGVPAAGRAVLAGSLSDRVVALAKAGLEGMMMTKLKIGTMVLFLIALACCGAGALTHALATATPNEPPQSTSRKSQTAIEPKENKPAAPVRPLRAGPPRVQVEHKSPILSLAWAPDGQWIATGTKDGTIRIVEAASGKEVRSFPTGHEVGGMSCAPDGTTLAVRLSDGTVSTWDVNTGNRLLFVTLAKSANKKAAAELLAFTPDGQAVMTVSVGNFSEWKLNRGFGGIGMTVADGFPAISPDGSLSGWAQSDGLVFLREYDPVANGMSSKQIKRLHVGKAQCIAFGPRGQLLAVGGEDKGVALWDLATGKKSGVLTGLDHAAAKMTFSMRGHLAALSSDLTLIRVWELSGNATQCEIKHRRGNMGTLALSPDGKMLAATSMDGKVVLLWNVAARELRHDGASLELPAEDLARLWNDLVHPDYERANSAWRNLGATGDNAITFLREQIRPIAVPVVDTEHIGKLVKELDAERFATREKATKELLAAGEVGIVPLQRLLEKSPSAEAANRATLILKKRSAPLLTPEHLRVLEAIELLEQVRTVKAIGLLQEIERDALVADIRLSARQALQRLAALPADKE